MFFGRGFVLSWLYDVTRKEKLFQYCFKKHNYSVLVLLSDFWWSDSLDNGRIPFFRLSHCLWEVLGSQETDMIGTWKFVILKHKYYKSLYNFKHLP